MRIDYGGAVIPWYDRPLIGGYNYTWEEKPVAPPVEEVKQYIANETYIQEKMQEGGGGIGGLLTNVVNPILDPMAADPIKTAAMLAAAVFAPELIPLIAGADTAIAGGTPEDVIKSAAIAYATQAVGQEIGSAIGGENIALPSETPYIDLPDGEVLLSANVPPPALPDDASRLAQMLKEFENPTELTGPTIDVADRVSIENARMVDSQAPIMPNNLQDTAYLDPGLIDVAPDNVTISTPNISGTNQIGTNIGQVGGGIIGSNIGGGTGVKPNLSAGELTVSGNRDTFDPWDNPEPPPYEPTNPTQPDATNDPTGKLKLGNLLKSTSALPKSTQQQSNLANVLRGTQMPQSLLPSIYKQANPFNFGQQNQPVQDTNALAKLLRTA